MTNPTRYRKSTGSRYHRRRLKAMIYMVGTVYCAGAFALAIIHAIGA